MPRLSVVVPIYNVEDYLEACLDSIAAQTFRDLEVILVNDGSTDSSPQIAEAYAERDGRFKVVHRPNGGLSAARNTGLDHVTGDYLAFVDSDDVLPANAYELMIASLEESGSDFATGKVLRLTPRGTSPTRFLAGVYREPRQRTHITEHRLLLADRIAWNKVFRRSFWDAQGLRFPEGRINEDIPVMLPLHFSATAVDVVSEPVYLWRIRDTGELSITERRAEVHALKNRIWAVRDVHDWLASHGLAEAKHWYDTTLVADDLKYYLNVLDIASDEYRQLFLDEVNALLDGADDDIYDPLPAIERLKWHLVRRRLLAELLEVLRFQKEDLEDTPPVRVDGEWLGDYPFRTDGRLAIPRSIYRVEPELRASAHIQDMGLDGDRLRIRGWAWIDGIGASEPGAQTVQLSLVRPGRFMRLRTALLAPRVRTKEVHRPDANARSGYRTADLSWAGFEASFDCRRLGRGGWRQGHWELYVTVEAGGLKRRGKTFGSQRLMRPAAVELPSPEDVLVRIGRAERQEIRVRASKAWAAVRDHRRDGDALILSGELRGLPADGLRLELEEARGRRRQRYDVDSQAPHGFTVRLALERIAGGLHPENGEAEEDDDDTAGEPPSWELHLAGGGRRVRLALPEDGGAATSWPVGERDVLLVRTLDGDASLAVRDRRAIVTAARWREDGALELDGERVPPEAGELVVFSTGRLIEHTFPLTADGDRFRATATPAAIASLAGRLPLPEGHWRLGVRTAGAGKGAPPVPLAIAPALARALPLETVVDHKRFRLLAGARADVLLVVGRDHDWDENGAFRQRQLRRTAYAPKRLEPLADAVVYSSFRGRQYSDSPRAIHEELLRRDARVEHLWVVRDAGYRVPDGATALREGSREHYEAMGRARYVVFNDHFPDWFERRDDQTCVQTWHGTPIKKLGFDVSRLRGTRRRFEREWGRHQHNWQHVVSPNPFSTPILRSAYELTESEMIETGYPRDDVLASAARREAAGRELRARLGIPQDARTILYAPTFRDQFKDARGRFRLDPRLEIDRLLEVAGGDTMVLVRKHHYIADDIPTADDGSVRDVSRYPDGTELLLAADVLVTDYSSMSVDFANTGRPIVFYAYDLEDYRDEVRGFYVDFEATMPGPVLRTGAEVADALRDVDAVAAAHAERYRAFQDRFCALDDGHAAERVVDRLFSDVLPPRGGGS